MTTAVAAAMAHVTKGTAANRSCLNMIIPDILTPSSAVENYGCHLLLVKPSG
jgi:hypothetical protein